MTRPALSHRSHILGVLAVGLVWSSILTWLRYGEHQRFQSEGDFGIYQQGLWHIDFSQTLYLTTRHSHLLGDHLCLILFALAPLYRLMPSALFLIWLGFAALAAAAVPLFLLAVSELESVGLAWALTLLWLAYLPGISIALYPFHPDIFEVPFLLAAWYCLRREKWRGFYVFLFLTLLCKEDVSLTVGGIGLYLLVVRRNWKHGAITMGLAVAWLAGAITVISALSPEGYLHSRSYLHLLQSPRLIGSLLAQWLPQDLQVWEALAVPGALMLFFHPAALLIVGPALTENLLSSYFMQHSIYYHYFSAVVPIVVGAQVVGLKYVLQRRPRLAGALLALMAMGTVGILWRDWPSAGREGLPPAMQTTAYRLLSEIPGDASVAVTGPFIAHVSNRERAYLLPDSFATTYWASQIRNMQWPDYVLVVIGPPEPVSEWTPQELMLSDLLHDPHYGILDGGTNLLLFKAGQDPHPGLLIMARSPLVREHPTAQVRAALAHQAQHDNEVFHERIGL